MDMTAEDPRNIGNIWPIPNDPSVSAIPFANQDVFEDENHLMNRLFYLVPDFSSGKLRCFFYFEDNLFAKGLDGDMTLLKSSCHLFIP